jgi:hypothetical protein
LSNYTPIVSYGPKDTLIHGDPAKGIKGVQIDAELQAIAAAIASKVETGSATTVVAAGTYEAPFLSGSIQVKGADGSLAGYGDLQWGFNLPNASGTPCSGLLVGGAGKSQVVILTDEQIPGQKGITVIRTAGDASSTAPANQNGGDLLDFAGGTINGQGGLAKYQAGTSVNAQGGTVILHGGNSTNGAAGPAYVQAGETGTAGNNVELIATKLSGVAGEIRFRVNSTILQQILEHGEIVLTQSGTGAGAAGQVLTSGGLGASPSWQGGTTLSTPGYTILPGGAIFQWGGATTPTGSIPVDQNITFPLVFPTACFGVFVCTNRSVNVNGQATNGSNFASNITTTGATITIDASPNATVSSWFAIGR